MFNKSLSLLIITVPFSLIPFNISREVPNSDTMAAINELEEFKKNPGKYKRYSSFSELLDEVREDA